MSFLLTLRYVILGCVLDTAWILCPDAAVVVSHPCEPNPN